MWEWIKSLFSNQIHVEEATLLTTPIPKEMVFEAPTQTPKKLETTNGSFRRGLWKA